MRVSGRAGLLAPAGWDTLCLMPLRLTRRVTWALLLPLLLLFGGMPAGAWHCADGSRCEESTVLTCCCGCPEGAAASEHECHETGPLLIAATCGCYFEADQFQPRAGSKLHFQDAPALLPQETWRTPISLRTQWGVRRDPGTSPPRYLVSPRDSRGPPRA